MTFKKPSYRLRIVNAMGEDLLDLKVNFLGIQPAQVEGILANNLNFILGVSISQAREVVMGMRKSLGQKVEQSGPDFTCCSTTNYFSNVEVTLSLVEYDEAQEAA